LFGIYNCKYISLSCIHENLPDNPMSATLNLLEVSRMRVQLKGLENKITSSDLSLFERCELEDEILELREQLGQFDRNKWDNTVECLNCGS
jgi:hypothetical protein